MSTPIKHIILSFLLVNLSVVYTFSQEYEWGSLPLGGGGFVSAVIAHPTEKNLFYARTDVGGMYRWVESTKSWKPINDWISKADKGLYGIDAFAVDPNNPGKLYALAGTSYFSNGKTVIMISNDYGETFTTVDVSSQFKTHGNGEGRHTGEKLAVDPTNANTLYCGTRSNGLFKSTNGGASWSNVSALTVSGTSVAGVSFVTFDATGNVYVGLSKKGNSIWMLAKGGSTWQNITPSVGANFYPHRGIIYDGTLYVTFASDFQSNMSSHDGAVCKYKGSWTTITPSTGHNYGGISVVGSRIVVTSTGDWNGQLWKSTGNTVWGDEIFVSDNGGSSWTSMFSSSKVTMDANGNPWVVDHAMHWTGCAVLDPFNANRAFFTSGNGIFGSENISTSGLTLKFMCAGLEETVPLDLTTPMSGGLISAIGDYDGATYTINAQGGYDTPLTVHKPENGSNYGVDISTDGSLAVRLVKKAPFVLYSTNQGRTWTGCAANKGGSEENGGVAVSADGSTIVYCPGGVSSFYYSTNKGGSWTQCNGVSMSGGYPVADKVKANYFYAYNGTSVYVSSDGGKNWSLGGSCATDWTASLKIRTAPNSAGDVWVPCGGNGLYRSTNYASSFSKIASITSCSAVGFGKAAEGKTFPTVYIWGKVGSVEGLFSSIDAGSTWTRINDDAHQFGGPGNSMAVVGDMGTYGVVYMGTVGRGVIYGEKSVAQCATPTFDEPTLSLCGQTTLLLNSNTTTNTNVAYSWYKDDIEIAAATAATYNATQAGVYKVVRDSAACSRSASITVTAELPEVALGSNVILCSALTETLRTDAVGTNMTYVWKKDGSVLSGKTTASLLVSDAGVYTCTIAALGCASKSDDCEVSSNLLSILSDTLCKDGGKATVTVQSTGGPFSWHSAATGGSALFEGAIYQPEISNTTTLYVQDNGGAVYTFGATAPGSEGWSTTDFSGSVMAVTVAQPCTLASVDIRVDNFWSEAHSDNSATSLVVRLLNAATSTVLESYTTTLTATGAQTITLNFPLQTGSYLLDLVGTTAGCFFGSTAMTPVSQTGYVSIANNNQSWAVQGCFYNYTIKIGSSCVRTPVTAVVDANRVCPTATELQSIDLVQGWNIISLYVIPADNSIETVFSGLAVDMVKNNEGFYKFGNPSDLQSLLSIQAGEGYLVKMNAPGTLNVEGVPLQNYVSQLSSGWNLLGVPQATEKNISDLPSSVSVIKDLDAFFSTDGSGTMQTLKPGCGYYIKTDSALSIEW